MVWLLLDGSAYDYGPSFSFVPLEAFLLIVGMGYERSLCLFFLEISLSRVFIGFFSSYHAYIHIPSRCYFLMLIRNWSL
jgi:hypothetical protein